MSFSSRNLTASKRIQLVKNVLMKKARKLMQKSTKSKSRDFKSRCKSRCFGLGRFDERALSVTTHGQHTENTRGTIWARSKSRCFGPKADVKVDVLVWGVLMKKARKLMQKSTKSKSRDFKSRCKSRCFGLGRFDEQSKTTHAKVNKKQKSRFQKSI